MFVACVCLVKKFTGIPRAPLSYEMLTLKTRNTLYLQNWVVPDLNYDLGRIEIYKAHPDATAELQFDTSRGDIRIMTELPIAED